MVTCTLVLAATLGAGKIPIHKVVAKFPDASGYVGRQEQQLSGLFRAIAEEAATEMRTAGPGPGQMAARWRSGKLTPDERVAILLTGASFHDPVLLPAYRDAADSKDEREKKAALVGLGWLFGESAIWLRPQDDRPEYWAEVAKTVDQLIAATRERTLVAIWADSYLGAIGMPTRPGLTFTRKADRCLDAIRELATPADLDELVALWPQVSDLRHRNHLRRTIEMITFRSFESPSSEGPRAPTGTWQVRAAVDATDAWVSGLCGTRRGDLVAAPPAEPGVEGAVALGGEAGPWIRVVNLEIPSLWPVAVERLSAYGAPAVSLNRMNFDDPRNREAIRKVRRYFPISSFLVKGEIEEVMKSKPGAPSRGPRVPMRKKEVGGEESPGTP